VAERPIIFQPNVGPQTQFLASRASEVLYGGAAGGGKSAALIAMPLRWVHHPKFRALVLRRETPQLKDLWDKACELYSRVCPSAKPRHDEREWRFPSGARIWFTHVEHESDIARFDGHEYQLIAFDELTHFSESQYVRVCARLRGPADLPKYARATTNPGGSGHEWVMRRWAPWLNPESPVRALPGKKLWYLPPGGNDADWCDTGERRVESDGAITEARSRVFIPARLADNPHVGQEYRAQLLELDPVRRAQLLEGNWLVTPAAGAYFKRAWWKFASAVPPGARGIRYWDRAATVAKPGKDPDWTVGLRMWATDDGRYFIDNLVRFRGTPADVEKKVRATALLDTRRAMIGIEQDPGSAGVFEADYYVRALAGYRVRTFRVTKDKVTRAGPVSSQVEHGNVYLVGAGASWIEPFVQECEAFPDGSHDDQVDALSGAFAALAKPKPVRGTMQRWAGV
jgi:predicted phage terminase large subunit-like protein